QASVRTPCKAGAPKRAIETSRNPNSATAEWRDRAAEMRDGGTAPKMSTPIASAGLCSRFVQESISMFAKLYRVPETLRLVRLQSLQDHGVRALAIRCDRCHKTRNVAVKNLVRDLDANLLLRLCEFAEKLKCRKCGNRAITIVALYGPPPN